MREVMLARLRARAPAAALRHEHFPARPDDRNELHNERRVVD